MSKKPKYVVVACKCTDCDELLMVRDNSFFGSGWGGDWYMVKDVVWNAATRSAASRFLCVKCLERRFGRKLTAVDFKRSAKVNFVGDKSIKLRRRMAGLKPAKRLIETTFTP